MASCQYGGCIIMEMEKMKENDVRKDANGCVSVGNGCVCIRT